MRNLALITLIAVLFTLVACQTPGGSGQSPNMAPGTTGAPAISTQGAQTIGGSQGQTPQVGTSGTSTQNWYFAAQGSGEIQSRILSLAEKMGWTAEQIASALTATNGAPQTVSIQTGDQSISTGPASPVGATSGGDGQSGGADNAITRP